MRRGRREAREGGEERGRPDARGRSEKSGQRGEERGLERGGCCYIVVGKIYRIQYELVVGRFVRGTISQDLLVPFINLHLPPPSLTSLSVYTKHCMAQAHRPLVVISRLRLPRQFIENISFSYFHSAVPGGRTRSRSPGAAAAEAGGAERARSRSPRNAAGGDRRPNRDRERERERGDPRDGNRERDAQKERDREAQNPRYIDVMLLSD